MAKVKYSTMGSLFPCLPDEIGFECLLRVELNSHHNLRCVSKSWNAALKTPRFYQERKRLKISEQRICLLQDTYSICNRVLVYDLQKDSCKSLPPIPLKFYRFSHCYFVKQKLVLITDMVDYYTRACIWLYDFTCSKWRQGAKMPRWRSRFASAADEHRGLIYVAGGYGRLRNPVRSASVYNVEEDKWDLLSDMNTYMEDFTGAFAGGKFYVMGKPTWPTFEVFDSYTRSWKTLENRLNSMHFLSVFGRLHCLSAGGLIEYDYSRDKLHIVGPLPTEDFERLIEFATVVGHKIFLSKWDPIEGEGFYMLTPPSETGGAIKWIAIGRPSGLQDFVICAATQVDL
ncbi:F-box/kelch-repeat protein At1g80440 [Cryptomeria japonica]|uniref:F-box/kelch-repeat protein At1g80440 n=1 Tax=Cryptomeria japonica TaxID=3369 RepID=UPI0027D9F4D9|nr:F-box/kelch-repeat protein At1g80440 [Cryptomeria japonica]